MRRLTKEAWTSKALHGNHLVLMPSPHINNSLLYGCLQNNKLSPETEGFLIPIQNEEIR